MKTDDQIELLKKVMDALEQQLDDHFEIVLHDLRRPYDSTIVDIRNGHITGRKIGDCGTNHGWEIIHGTEKDGNEYNYITHLPDGRILRSSSVYFRDEDGKVVVALCMNQDISETLRLEQRLHTINKYVPPQFPQKEVFARSITELLDYYIEQSQQQVGKQASEMNRAEKIEMVRLLDQKGVFLITRSSERVCETLGISKFTLYNYLELIRADNGAEEKE